MLILETGFLKKINTGQLLYPQFIQDIGPLDLSLIPFFDIKQCSLISLNCLLLSKQISTEYLWPKENLSHGEDRYYY